LYRGCVHARLTRLDRYIQRQAKCYVAKVLELLSFSLRPTIRKNRPPIDREHETLAESSNHAG
jgi:hypothetical protein